MLIHSKIYISFFSSVNLGSERDYVCKYEHCSKKSFLFKSFVKIELSYVFTINMFSTAENCMEKGIIL